MQRAGMKSFARMRAVRFDWQKLVTPITDKAVVADWQAKQSEISKLENAATSVSTKVEPIDWAYYEKSITTPGVVAEMKAKYEALSFPTVDPMNEEATAKIEAIEASIVEAKKAAALGINELTATDKVIEQVNKCKAEGLEWNLEEFYKFIPGMLEQHKEEYESEDYLVPDNMMKLDSVDWKAAGEDFQNGVDPDMGAADAKVGDMDLAEEVQLVKEGRWSVARCFASKEERAAILEKTDKLLSSA